jgi:transcription elongation GreA/GreB family factor
MSRAFVSEETVEAERPVSATPNLVTPRGLGLIDARVVRLEGRLAEAAPEVPERAGLARDLRYWRARRTSAQLVALASGAPDEVAFGTKVTIRQGGTTTSYRIIGEDEADPPKGLLSWTSPLAEVLMGARVGDVVERLTGGPMAGPRQGGWRWPRWW